MVKTKGQILATHFAPFFSLLHKSLVSSNSFKIFYLKNHKSINYKNYIGVLKISSSFIREVIWYTFDDFLIFIFLGAKGNARTVSNHHHLLDRRPSNPNHSQMRPVSNPSINALRSTTGKGEAPRNGVAVRLRATSVLYHSFRRWW